MSLLEPPPEKSHKSQVMAITIGVLVLALAVVLYFTFRYYPEKKATAQFFNALVAGDTDKAYELWKPGPSYRKDDFLADWGASGYYGSGQELQNHESERAQQNRFHRRGCGAKSLFSVAQCLRRRKKPQN